MDTLTTLLSHRSIRTYKSDPVPDEMLYSIIEAAIRVSTTGNMQVYSIIITKDEAIKKQLLPCHFGQEMVIRAPVILTFCADFNRFNQWCRMRNAEPAYDNFLSFYTASIDALLAAQNACIAAESFGLGICYLGTTTYMSEQIAGILDCPSNVVPVTSVVLGWPDENPPLTERLPRRAVVHYEKYQDFKASDIDELYADREASELTQNLLKENQLETLAQVFTNKRYTKKDNLHFSQTFLEFIAKQSFMNNDS